LGTSRIGRFNEDVDVVLPTASSAASIRPAALCLLAGLFAAAASIAPAVAMVGGAQQATGGVARSLVMIVGSYGTACTATAVAPDLLLTAAHCVQPSADYKLAELSAGVKPTFKDIARIARDPQFDIKKLFGHVATADVALAKLAQPLPAKLFSPLALDEAALPPRAGDSFLVAGYGVSVRGDGRTTGTLRVANLVATGLPNFLQLRLVDPRTKDQRAGLGACAGDSGAPVLRDDGGTLAIFGVVSWSTGPRLSAGCGGLTGVTPLAHYRAWIRQTARALGSQLAP
jgi:hypothetical protein